MQPAVAEDIQSVAHNRERRRAGRAAKFWLLQAKELDGEVFDRVAEHRNLQHPRHA